MTNPSATSDFRVWRIERGYTQKQAAKALGFCVRQIKSYDAGTKNPTRAVRLAMLALARGLDDQLPMSDAA